ncbi:hypothetical protein ABZ128_29260 [Streptomyces sp. NPDC006326]|uniref:hypothetical protein n=1 Tax=Streptomyces sp. NPDC006326 TaxID=3156752 RepID=UPI0033A270AD
MAKRFGTFLKPLGKALGTSAALVTLGWAAWRWAATGMPMSPLPGSPWPYLATWGALCLAGCLLLRWATARDGAEGTDYVVAVLAFAGIRLSLAHRPGLTPLWAYAAGALAAGAAAAVLWRRSRRTA